jgi:pimeloyl-ACP methyl ester carboxylesterase
VGVEPTVATLEEIADRTPAAMPGFGAVPDLRWAEETVRHFVQLEGRVGLPYDPALGDALKAALSGPLPDAWPLFEACAGLPLALIRGEGSDVITAATAAEMRRRRPDMLFVEVASRGHVPFLDEPEALACVGAWLELVRTSEAARAPVSGS